MFVLSLFIVLSISAFSADALGRTQYVRAKGRVICPSNPQKAAGAIVKLIDEDDGPDPDDLMARGVTDANGNFDLTGSESEFTNIDPRLKIYHHCNQGIGARCLYPCRRRVKVIIPDSYISRTPIPAKVFDFGVYNLDMYQSGEECDCI